MLDSILSWILLIAIGVCAASSITSGAHEIATAVCESNKIDPAKPAPCVEVVCRYPDTPNTGGSCATFSLNARPSTATSPWTYVITEWMATLTTTPTAMPITSIMPAKSYGYSSATTSTSVPTLSTITSATFGSYTFPTMSTSSATIFPTSNFGIKTGGSTTFETRISITSNSSTSIPTATITANATVVTMTSTPKSQKSPSSTIYIVVGFLSCGSVVSLGFTAVYFTNRCKKTRKQQMVQTPGLGTIDRLEDGNLTIVPSAEILNNPGRNHRSLPAQGNIIGRDAANIRNRPSTINLPRRGKFINPNDPDIIRTRPSIFNLSEYRSGVLGEQSSINGAPILPSGTARVSPIRTLSAERIVRPRPQLHRVRSHRGSIVSAYTPSSYSQGSDIFLTEDGIERPHLGVHRMADMTGSSVTRSDWETQYADSYAPSSKGKGPEREEFLYPPAENSRAARDFLHRFSFDE